MSVFVFRTGQLGDSLVALPAVHEISRHHPETKLTLITNVPQKATFVASWEVFKLTGLFDGVIHYEPRNVRSLAATLHTLRSARPALLYYLAPERSRLQLIRDAFFFRVLAKCEVIGMSASGPDQPSGERALEEHARLLSLVRSGLQWASAPMSLISASSDVRRTIDERYGAFLGGEVVCVGAGSKMPAKRWFPERFVSALSRAAVDYPDLRFVFLGGSEERATAAEIAAGLPAPRVLNLVGSTSLEESIEIARRCRLYFGNDTGTMHLAASVGTPVVAIFTARDAAGRWDPWGQGHTILRREVPCGGCMLEVCEDEQMRCLDLISAEAGYQALAGALSRARRPRNLTISAS
jgi:ADP-heptose:LPS heptosyltransferase